MLTCDDCDNIFIIQLLSLPSDCSLRQYTEMIQELHFFYFSAKAT